MTHRGSIRMIAVLLVAIVFHASAPDNLLTAHAARADDAAPADVGTCPPDCVEPIWTRLDLPRFVHAAFMFTEGISNNRTVVGWAPRDGDRPDVPFYWTASTGLKALPLPAVADGGRVFGLSPNGQWAVGYGKLASGRPIPLRWNLTDGPSVRRLSVCTPGTNGSGNAVNNDGTVVGLITGGGSQDPVTNVGAAYWPDPASCGTVLTFVDPSAAATGINNAGDIVGSVTRGKLGFIFHYQSPTSAHFLTGGSPVAINNAGTAIGFRLDEGGSGATIGTWPAGSVEMTPVATSTQLVNDPAISNTGRLVWNPSNQFEATTEFHGTVKALPAIPTGVNNCGDISAWTGGLAVLFLKTACD